MVLADDLRQRLARRRQRQLDEAVAKARAAVKAEYERRQQQRERQREQRLEQQTQLYSRELDAWISRRLAAERSGEPFSEAMPNLADYLRLGDENADSA